MKEKKENFTLRRNFILGSGAVDLFMANYLVGDQLEEIRGGIRAKSKTLESETISYRIINHWEKEGLVSNMRPSGKGWRKYSLIDRVWVQIIMELRKFGFPLEQIKKVKQGFEYENETEHSASLMPYLEAYIVLAFFFKEPCFLLIFSDGEALLTTKSEYAFSVDLGSVGNHIKIDVNQMLQEILPEKNLAPVHKNILELTSEEMQVMLFIRTGNFETITVKRKNGKIDLIETSENINAEAMFIEIMKEHDYQNIEVKTASGKTICIKRPAKQKI